MGLFKRKRTLSPKSVLFVCTANVTRSVTAEALFRSEIAKYGDDWRVGSAGVSAIPGNGPNSVVAHLLFNRDINIYDHKAVPISKNLLDNYYWILVMEAVHKEAVLKLAPDMENRVSLLREFGLNELDGNLEMPDPTGKEPEDFVEMFQILDSEIPRIAEYIQIKASDLMVE